MSDAIETTTTTPQTNSDQANVGTGDLKAPALPLGVGHADAKTLGAANSILAFAEQRGDAETVAKVKDYLATKGFELVEGETRPRTMFDPGEAPEDYGINLGNVYSFQEMKGLSSDELANMRAGAQQAVHAAGLSPRMGGHVAECGLRAMKEYGALSPSEQAEYSRQQEARVAALGRDLTEVKDAVKQAVFNLDMRDHDLAMRLLNGGFFQSADVMVHIADSMKKWRAK